MAVPGQQEEGPSFSVWDLWSIVRMQSALVATCLAVGLVLAVLYTALAPRKYRSVSVVHLSPAVGQEIETDRVLDSDQYNRWNRATFVKTQLDILQSRDFLGRVLDGYEGAGFEDGLVHDDAGLLLLASYVDVKPRQGTELIDISVTTDDPQKSMHLANLVSEEFEKHSHAALTDAAKNAKVWLDQQIVDAQEQIERLGGQIREYQRENDLADAEDRSMMSSAMDSLKGAYGQARSDRVIHENLVRTHERLSRQQQWEQLAKEMPTPIVNQYLEDYARLTTEQARVHARYGEKMVERVEIDAAVARIESQLRVELENTLNAERTQLRLLKEKEEQLSSEIASGKEGLLGQQQARLGYDRKKLELDALRDNYARLQARRSELELQSRTKLNNVRIIERARAIPIPVSPSWLFDIAVGAVAGLVVGGALAFLREWLDDTISSPLEVTTFLRAPFLGLIPKIEGETDEVRLGRYTHDNPRSSVAEALRTIRTLLEMSPEGSPKRLLVTSAVQAEGKTSTTVHLGVTFSKLDRRVLLVDCDLRRPRLHKVFGKSREIGLTTALHGDCGIDEIIQETGVPNLWFVASGRSGDRPSELLASAALPRVLAELESRFDMMVFDTPPSGVLSDARILSKHVDGLVMVVREHSVSRGMIREALQGLEQVGARIYGVAVNAVDLRNGRTSYKYNYGYGYRYARYNYQYGERSDTAAK